MSQWLWRLPDNRSAWIQEPVVAEKHLREIRMHVYSVLAKIIIILTATGVD